MSRAKDMTQSRDKPKYIVVEGPIGVGKTTLVTRLAGMYGADTVFEIFEENPFLAMFYGDKERFAFQTEMFFLLSRYKQQEQFAQESLFPRLWVSDYLFVKCRLFAGLTLSDDEIVLYDRMYSILSEQTPKPDIVIYLTAPLDVLMQRIERRGRSYEKGFDREYLERLRRLYNQFFEHYDETPLLKVDTSDIDFSQDDDSIRALLEQATDVYQAARRGPQAIEF